MLLYDSLRMREPVERVREALIRRQGVVAGLAAAAYRQACQARGQDVAVDVMVGSAYTAMGAAVLPLSWEPVGPRPALPHITADVEVSPSGDGGAVLRFRGWYDPPAGMHQQGPPQVLLHDACEAMVRDLLRRLEAELGPVAAGGSAAPGEHRIAV